MQTTISYDSQAAPTANLATAGAGKVLLSFDLQADFGFLRKPDVNEGLSLSYNLLHRPALLGILGAIAGLGGYTRRGEIPEYWQLLGHLRVGVEPLAFVGTEAREKGSVPRHERGTFQKSVLSYTNTVGYANADGTWILTENTLVRPAYRCYVLLDRHQPVEQCLYERLRGQQAEYLPYLGKNEFALSWSAESVREYAVQPFAGGQEFEVRTAFYKPQPVRTAEAVADEFSFFDQPLLGANSFFYFERLPVDFDPTLLQYRHADFVFSNARFRAGLPVHGLYQLAENGTVVQLH